jgi:hypothetical protein
MYGKNMTEKYEFYECGDIVYSDLFSLLHFNSFSGKGRPYKKESGESQFEMLRYLRSSSF